MQYLAPFPFSSPAFGQNERKRQRQVVVQALAYAGYADGPLAGIGYYYILSRPSSTGKWNVAGTFVAWIS
jgi:hypothetical protein